MHSAWWPYGETHLPTHTHSCHTPTCAHLAKAEAEVAVEAWSAVKGEPMGRGGGGCEWRPVVPHALSDSPLHGRDEEGGIDQTVGPTAFRLLGARNGFGSTSTH